MVQILSGLICCWPCIVTATIGRARQLRTQIENELRCWPMGAEHQEYGKEQNLQALDAKT